MTKMTRILIAEDEKIIALELEERLTDLGYSVLAVASSGKQAVEKAIELHPDLVLMDIRLQKGMDGVTAAQQIRSRLDIPVIYLTAYADDDTLHRARATNPAGYLLKPYRESELVATIEMALAKHESEAALRANEQKLRHYASQLQEHVSHLQQVQEALRRERDFLTGIMETSPMGITLVNLQGQFIFANTRAEEILGLNKGEITRRTYNDPEWHITGLDGHPFPDEKLPYRQVIDARQPVYDVCHAIKRPDGQQILLSTNATFLRNQAGQVSGVVVIIDDITQQIRAQEALQQHTAELQARNEELDAFAHTVAHDLREPLSSIVGHASLLRNHYAALSAEQAEEYLRWIVEGGLEMKSIVEDLLLLAEVRRANVFREPLDMAEIVSKAQQRLSRMIDEYQAYITVAETWPVALGYGPWVEQVWVNYLSNAIKYGGQPPRIELGATAEVDSTIRFWIQDYGPGITPEDQEQLFTPFTRLGQARTKGYGLGLSIVQRIVDKLGGQVGVESAGVAGQGCLFSFTLPHYQGG